MEIATLTLAMTKGELSIFNDQLSIKFQLLNVQFRVNYETGDCFGRFTPSQ